MRQRNKMHCWSRNALWYTRLMKEKPPSGLVKEGRRRVGGLLGLVAFPYHALHRRVCVSGRLSIPICSFASLGSGPHIKRLDGSHPISAIPFGSRSVARPSLAKRHPLPLPTLHRPVPLEDVVVLHEQIL